MTKTTQTQNQRLVNYLSKRKTLTVKQARATLRVQNLSARICELRDSGYEIYTTKRHVKGTAVTQYVWSAHN